MAEKQTKKHKKPALEIDDILWFLRNLRDLFNDLEDAAAELNQRYIDTKLYLINLIKQIDAALRK